MNIFDRARGLELYLGPPGYGGATKTGLALGSAYSYASAGIAMGVRFVAPVSGNLTDVWFFVTAHLGTPGVTTCELRNCAASNKPGTTLHATQTVSPGVTDNKWINVHFTTPYSVTQGLAYFIVLGDAGWTTGKTITVGQVGGCMTMYRLFTFTCYTTTDGFTTAGTISSQGMPPIVLKFADGSVLGNPFTNYASYSSSMLERGFKICGLTEDLIITGVTFNLSSQFLSGIKIYKGSTAPGGTPDLTITFSATNYGYHTIFPAYIMRKNNIYRVVLTFSNNSTGCPYLVIEDYATGGIDLTNCGVGGGTIYETMDNNDGTWADHIDRMPEMGLLILDQSVQPGALVNAGLIGN